MKTYEMTCEELSEALAFRNSIFVDVDTDHWKAMDCTGVVARAEPGDFPDLGIGTEIVGFIPLQFRTQVLRPGVTAPVVYENAVGVDERLRSRGIGSRMIEAAADFMRDRADALFVIRGGEATTGYRFYRKSGHSDVCYAATFAADSLRIPAAADFSVKAVTSEAWVAREPELLELYRLRFGAYGGGRERGPGYWRGIFAGHVFKNRPWRLYLAADRTDSVCGYAIVVDGTWKDYDTHHFYEVIGASDDVVKALIAGATNDAGPGKIRFPSVSLDNPLASLLTELGCRDERTEPQIMARIINPERLFARLVDATGPPEKFRRGTHITCSTPHRRVELFKPEPTGRSGQAGCEIRLEMKEHALARLLCCRLDLLKAVDMEVVRCAGADADSLATLADICRPAPWVQWYTDYV